MSDGTRPRAVLKPLGACEPARRGPSAKAAYLQARGRALRLGDVVTAAGVSYVVRSVDPQGDDVAFDFSPDPAKRAVADAVFLVDASWSMRKADLPPTRLDAVKRALATALANSHDCVKRVAIGVFDASAAMVAPFAAPDSVDLPALDAVKPRGPGDALAALDLALDVLARDADPANEHVVFLATDSDVHLGEALERGARAARLGVAVHVLDAGSDSGSVLERLAQATSGTYHDAFGGVTFRPALSAVADRFGVPLSWRDPARGSGEAEFEVVLRAMTDEEAGDFPAFPRRLRRK